MHITQAIHNHTSRLTRRVLQCLVNKHRYRNGRAVVAAQVQTRASVAIEQTVTNGRKEWPEGFRVLCRLSKSLFSSALESRYDAENASKSSSSSSKSSTSSSPSVTCHTISDTHPCQKREQSRAEQSE